MLIKKKYLLITIIVAILLLTPIVHATEECNEQIVSSKIFQATSKTIHIGLVCSSDAKINIYSCEGYGCENKEFFKQTYKIEGVLGHVENFLLEDYYYYDCLECLQNSPAELKIETSNIIVSEGDQIEINAECTDPDGDETTLTYSGWMTSETKITDYEDSGTYQVTVKCYDVYDKGEQKKVNVQVIENNRPPKIVEVKQIFI